MTKEQLLSKFEYHAALAAEAARNGNWADMDHEDARAELALWTYWRLA
jgi:hypothetical protein